MVVLTKKIFATLAVAGSCLFCFSCAALPQKSTPAATAPTATTQPDFNAYYVPRAPAEGSLWTDSAQPLFVDLKARQVGDTVTVDIVENTSSKLSANTEADRSSSIDGSITNALGYMRFLESKNSKFFEEHFSRNQNGALTNKLFLAELANKFEGEGTSDRSGQVTASIGARIVQTLPNGNLIVYGKREMKVNNEVQIITVSGMVRPVDIDGDNRVKSTYLSDAKIEYYGKGVIADKQRPGWGARVVDKLWPF